MPVSIERIATFNWYDLKESPEDKVTWTAENLTIDRGKLKTFLDNLGLKADERTVAEKSFLALVNEVRDNIWKNGNINADLRKITRVLQDCSTDMWKCKWDLWLKLDLTSTTWIDPIVSSIWDIPTPALTPNSITGKPRPAAATSPSGTSDGFLNLRRITQYAQASWDFSK